MTREHISSRNNPRKEREWFLFLSFLFLSPNINHPGLSKRNNLLSACRLVSFRSPINYIVRHMWVKCGNAKLVFRGGMDSSQSFFTFECSYTSLFTAFTNLCSFFCPLPTLLLFLFSKHVDSFISAVYQMS